MILQTPRLLFILVFVFMQLLFKGSICSFGMPIDINGLASSQCICQSMLAPTQLVSGYEGMMLLGRRKEVGQH